MPKINVGNETLTRRDARPCPFKKVVLLPNLKYLPFLFSFLLGNCLVSLRMVWLNIASKFRGQPFHLPIRGAVHLMGVAPLRGVALNPHPHTITIVKAKNMEPIQTGFWQVSQFYLLNYGIIWFSSFLITYILHGWSILYLIWTKNSNKGFM